MRFILNPSFLPSFLPSLLLLPQISTVVQEGTAGTNIGDVNRFFSTRKYAECSRVGSPVGRGNGGKGGGQSAVRELLRCTLKIGRSFQKVSFRKDEYWDGCTPFSPPGFSNSSIRDFDLVSTRDILPGELYFNER